MSLDMELIKKLREATFAPLKDVKDALTETNNDFDAAVEWLKKKGAAAAAKKGDRETKEGAIKTRIDGNRVYAVKIACETDFVAKNDLFKELTDKLLDVISPVTTDVASLEQLPEDVKAQCEALVGEYVGKIGESMKLADVYIHNAPNKVYVYSHPGDKIVAIVYYTPINDNAELSAKNVALQIAAMNPEFLSVEKVSAEVRDELKAKFTEEVAASGKPADIVEKIVAGKLDKAFAENVLFEQASIVDDSKKVKDTIAGSADVTDYVRITVGN